MKWPSLPRILDVTARVWAIVRTRRLPAPDTAGATGRQYDSPEQGHAPPDAPHIPDDGTI